jgi:predicted ferric reductase
VAAYFGFNVFIHLFRLPFEVRFFFAFADRAGCVFIANLPLLYLLGAKNQPLKRLTGRSYEALNIYHRRVGEWMCFEALVHVAGMLVWRLRLTPDWLAPESLWYYFTHPLILLGIGAFVSYELLYFTSLASFRERWYELFLASHILLQIAALSFLWLHFHTSRPYVLASLAIFILDRVVWRIGLKSATVTANIEVLEDGDTVLLSANWDVPPARQQKTVRFFRQSILYGWHPADHIFISVPSLGISNALRAHPFTIASAAPAPNGMEAHAWLNLLIRAHSGFTLELLRHAQLNSTVSVRVDGPYGSQDPLNMLRASKTAVLVAGGSGIAVVFPLLWDLAMVHPGKRTIHLIWIVHSGFQRSWMPAERLDELRQAGVCITIPQPTVEAGRPDVTGYIAEIVAASPSDVGIVVSGPDGLNSSVRNACAQEIRSGADISLRVEKFGW